MPTSPTWTPPAAPLVIAHRGASAYRPEHTLAAYELAARMGADRIEVDLVRTGDGVLVARHELALDATTDVLSRPRLRRRRRAMCVDGVECEGVFVEDLTLPELRTLRATEPFPGIRPGSAAADRRHAVPTLQEVLDLRARLSRELGRTVGVCLELKHPAHHSATGAGLAEPLEQSLALNGLDGDGVPVSVAAFEVGVLRRLSGRIGADLVQLIEPWGAPADLARRGDGRTYDDMCTPAGLREIAAYAAAIGVPKARVVSPGCGAAAGLVADAHAAGLAVHVWTFRSENAFLPPRLRVRPRGTAGSPVPSDHGDALTEYGPYIAAGVDGLITDNPDTAVKARSAYVPSPPAPSPRALALSGGRT